MIGRGGQIGDPAAPLVVKEWIKGNPVEVKAGTNIYVVEIFGTTSLASRASITNLNATPEALPRQGRGGGGGQRRAGRQIKQFVQA